MKNHEEFHNVRRHLANTSLHAAAQREILLQYSLKPGIKKILTMRTWHQVKA
jgi:hypothetical protein